MTIEEINSKLSQLAAEPARENVLQLAFALLDWMGIVPNGNYLPQLVAPKTQRLHEYLAHAPQTKQGQLYRLSADKENIRIRFAVLKKLKKDYISQLVDNDPGLVSYQAFSKGLAIQPTVGGYIPTQPYFIHFVTTPDYNKLVLIFNQGEQKRILTLRNRLTNTQYNKIVVHWLDIGKKSKPEIASVLWKSLDIKEVNKEFYKQIKERFDALVGILKLSKPGIAENELKQFAVRLIGRYIFCWFLKEKGIIPAALLASATVEKNKSDYYQKFLLHLFFNTLNTEVQNRDPLALQGDELSKLFEKIPYLNGGLFEIHEQDEQLKDIEVSEWFVSFVQVLEGFDFTVDESSSNYQIVAIDPEMLGRIFENLLASQNPETEKMANQRNAFGAFYTSREIVDYMVDAALKAYLEEWLSPSETEETSMVSEPSVSYSGTLFQQLESQQTRLSFSAAADAEKKKKKEQLRQKINKLFAPSHNDNPFDKTETLKVQQALRQVKVLDPACGSGAFPMSMLLRLMQLREIVGSSLSNVYDLKSDILSHNIYGVDIMPMAVEIARLRAWLSLVLEAEYKPADAKHNFNIKALPNLDFKFVCANTLIDSGYEDFLQKAEYGSLTLLRLDGEIQKLERLRNNYFDPKGDQQQKYQLRKEFLKTQQDIKTEFSSLGKKWNIGNFLSKVDDWKPFDDNHPSSFFSAAWMFGVKDGFDIVIGNPPYVQIQKMDEPRKKELETQNFTTYERTGDLYQLFYEKGIQLLKTKGILSFITSNKWMRTDYGESTREYFAKHIAPVSVVDFGMAQMFESATTYTNILVARCKNGGSPTIPMCRIKNDFTNPAELESYINSNTIEIKNPGADTWVAYDKNEYALIQRIEAQGLPLRDWDITINRGILTGDNDVFIIEKDKRDKLIAQDSSSAELIRPILRGEDINAYVPEFAEKYLIATFPSLEINISEYPAIKKYLSLHKEKIEPKPKSLKGKWNGRKAGSYEWFETQDSIAYHKDFSKPKIIYPNMTKYLPFVYDESGILTNQKCFILTGEHLKYLTALFNSSLWKFSFKNRFPELLGDTYELSKVFFDKIPIKKPVGNYEKKLSALTDKIIAAKQEKKDTAELEKQVDVQVYHLYQLSYEDAKVIDPQLSEEEFEKYKP